MKELPILLDAIMLLALLNGSKTQLRRLVKPQPVPEIDALGNEIWRWNDLVLNDQAAIKNALPPFCPYGSPGDRLWVRETWGAPRAYDEFSPRNIPQDAGLFYHADSSYRNEVFEPSSLTRPSMSMPRWASRFDLDVRDVRVERLHEISYADADASEVDRVDAMHAIRRMYGSDRSGKSSPRGRRDVTWYAIKGVQSWEENPWIWLIDFRLLGQAPLVLNGAPAQPERKFVSDRRGT